MIFTGIDSRRGQQICFVASWMSCRLAMGLLAFAREVGLEKEFAGGRRK